MPATTVTLEALVAAVRAYFANRFPGRDVGEDSWLGKQAAAVSMGLFSLQAAVDAAARDGVPTDKTTSAGLDLFAYVFGVPSNAGGYGRHQAVAASGGVGDVTGVGGSVVADGTAMTASDGATRFATSGAVVVPGVAPATGAVTTNFVAVTKGSAGNLPVGSVLTFTSVPTGVDANVSLTSPLAGGLDVETDAALLARIYDRLQRPPKGGAGVDYRLWAEASSDAVARAYPYPNRDGLGTVSVVVASAGSGVGRRPSAAVATAADAYVNAVRPVTVEGYRTQRPAMPGGAGLTVRARLRPSQRRYHFDWDDTAAVYTVFTYATGSPATLELNTVAPASLKDAVDLGLRPRLQVESSYSAVPVQVRVTAWADGGGRTTLTLEDPLPDGFSAPSVSDRVSAGGPIATTIAQALLDYVDGLGPSRADGYADPSDVWDDTVAVARLVEICLSVTDPADPATRLASNVVGVNGVTVDGGVVDVVGSADIDGEPELLYAALVVVTQ